MSVLLCAKRPVSRNPRGFSAGASLVRLRELNYLFPFSWAWTLFSPLTCLKHYTHRRPCSLPTPYTRGHAPGMASGRMALPLR